MCRGRAKRCAASTHPRGPEGSWGGHRHPRQHPAGGGAPTRTLAPRAAPQPQSRGRTQTQGLRQVPPQAPWHVATEASLLSACSPGRLRCLSKTFHHRVPICSSSQPVPCIYLLLHTQMPTRMTVHLLSANPIPPCAGGCIHTTISSSRNQELESGTRLARKALEGDGVDGELQAERATPAPAHLWKQDDFSLKVTRRGVL